jgi:fructose-1,6-bisphosphatase/inositol monophosphatase family enzyme
VAEKSFYTVATGRGHGDNAKKIEAGVVSDIFETPLLKYRRFGSAALDLAEISAGRIDGVFLIGNNPWDYVAGFGILSRQEHVAVTEVQTGVFVVSRIEIHDTLVSIIKHNL